MKWWKKAAFKPEPAIEEAEPRTGGVDWLKAAPRDLEAVVFTQEEMIFLRSEDAPTAGCALISSLFDSKNEDILVMLRQRFQGNLH